MRNIFKIWLLKWHVWLNKLLVKHVDVSDSNDVVKVVTQKIGISWIDMINHVAITNKFFFPYKLMEVKLTYYNDANQNIGYLHFKEPVKIKAKSTQIVKMPSKMSNITALFNMVRLMITDDIKTRTVGTTTIRIFGINFEFPIDDIMIIDKDKVVLEEEEEREKKLALKAKKEEERKIEREKREEKRELRLNMLAEKRKEQRAKIKAKRKAQREKANAKMKERKEKAAQKKAARARLKRMKEAKNNNTNISESKSSNEQTKTPQENPVALDNSSND